MPSKLPKVTATAFPPLNFKNGQKAWPNTGADITKENKRLSCSKSVSYTHLDVYKRQLP